MTAAAAATETVTRLEPARDGRLLPYCIIAFGGLAAALLAGQPALAAIAAPFALALALGLRRTRPVEVTARMTLDAEQVLEGDLVSGRVELEWGEDHEARVLVDRLTGVGLRASAGPPAAALSVRGRRITLPIELRATQWGRHTTGVVWLRLEAPFSLLSWTGKVAAGPTLRVLPGGERLNRLLTLPEARTILGAHRSPRLGDGHEFAELRPYTPGDRLRNLNWGATARHRTPYVNRHHPERSGDVVIAFDAFADGSRGSTEALARAARAAWTLASAHLRANDRVGLVALGGSTRWLPPAGGRRARYRLLETLLSIGGEVSDVRLRQDDRAGLLVPASALIVVLTPLHDPRTLRTVQGWRARGRSAAVILIDSRDVLGDPASAAETLARRLWTIELDRRKRRLGEIGVPVVTVTNDGLLAGVVTALRRARRAPSVRLGRG